MENRLIYPNVLVGLDYTEMDDIIIDYCQVLLANFSITTLNFVHVIPQWILPTQLARDLMQTDSVQLQLESQVRSHFEEKLQSIRQKYQAVNINLQILHGKPYVKLLLSAKADKVSLFVVGKKKLSGGSGLQARRVARNLDCDLCFIPEHASQVIRRILVPIDFSKYSLRALQTALQLKNQMVGVQIVALHIIPLPSVSYSLNRHADQLIEKLHDHSLQNYRSFIEREKLLGRDIEFKLITNEHFDVGRHIQEEARLVAADLLIIGAKGDDSSLSDFVFGSVTEKLVTLEDNLPVFVTR